jgi:hypothetical protein
MNAIPICLKFHTQAAGNALCGFEALEDFTLVGASFSLDAVTGSPTTVTMDVNDDGAGIAGFTAVNVGTTAGAVTPVRTTHYGGAVAIPADIAAGSEVDVDLNISGGTSPTAGGTVVLWVLPGKKN